MPPNLFSRVLERAIDVSVLAIGWWLILLSVFTCIEMVSRKLFAFSSTNRSRDARSFHEFFGCKGFPSRPCARPRAASRMPKQ